MTMANLTLINHVTVVVDDFEKARAFYEGELGLESLPAFQFDFPVQFYRINEHQQLHVTEWEGDATSFRGHVCFHVDDFDSIFYRMKELDVIDTKPWGRCRRLPDGSMQMFVRDPAGNLLEMIAPPEIEVDPKIFEDEMVDAEADRYVSERGDTRGFKDKTATLHHGK